MAKNRLKIGDTIGWKSGWGKNPPVSAEVKSIEICAVGCRNGKQVQSVAWSTVENDKRNVVVTLTNGHWAQSRDNSFF